MYESDTFGNSNIKDKGVNGPIGLWCTVLTQVDCEKLEMCIIILEESLIEQCKDV